MTIFFKSEQKLS